jgi:hypothetical protein
VVLPVAGVVGGAVQVGRGIANQSEATQEKKKGRIWNKVCKQTQRLSCSSSNATDGGATAAHAYFNSAESLVATSTRIST